MSVDRVDRPETAALRAVLAAMPAAEASAAVRGVTLYKVMGKMFAILEDNKIQCVILKSDPHLAEILREQYAGVGRRSHLDPRFWIAVTLDADVPADEIERLAAASYDLVCAGLTKKQRAELAAMAS